jgi:flagellar hook assembly protein FlgD
VRKTSSVEIYTYLKFNVSGLTSIVQSAKIRLYVIDAGNDGGTIYLVSNNYQGSSMVWTDAGLTWNNAPAVSGNPLSSAGSVTAGQIAEFDVTSAITSNRIYSFGIKNSSSDLVRYSSKEGSNLPELVIQASSDPSIAPAITSFTPTSGPVGTEVTITGSHFIGATSVAFNATPATNFAVDSDTQIRAVVPEGATTGKISVTNAAGTGTSAEDFVVTTGGLITLTFNPTDDAYARSSSPSSNYGAATELRVRKTSSVEIYTYLKFNVSGLTGTVQSAMIRLHVLDGGNDGGSIYSVSNNHRGSNTAWTEAGLNWSNAPAISGTPLSSAGAVTAGQTVELDVISAITGDGIYSFGIKNASSDLVRYSSKEGSTLPELIIKTTSGSISASKAADLAPDGSRPGEVNITTALPERIVLHPSYPNPFNAETKIVYELPQRSYVRLSLYDLMSHEIKVLANQEQEAGAYEVRWDGRDASGNLVPSGIYIYSLQVGSYRSSKKLMVLK